MTVLRRNLEAAFYQGRGDRETLVPMLDKLSPREIEALYRFLENVKLDARDLARKKPRFF